jgi:hypothetical protein
LIASFSACTDPISLIDMVPVIECKIPTVTVSSVTASPVVLTSAVLGVAACTEDANMTDAASAIRPLRKLSFFSNDRSLAIISIVPMVIPRSI